MTTESKAILTAIEGNIYYFKVGNNPYVFRCDIDKDFLKKMYERKPWKMFNLVKRAGTRLVEVEDSVYNLENSSSQRYHIGANVVCYTGVNPDNGNPAIILEALAPGKKIISIKLNQRNELEKLKWVLEKII